MKLSALEIQHLNNARALNHDALVKAHQDIHALICENQDEACSVPADIAVQVLHLLHQFALVKTNNTPYGREYFALSLLEKDAAGFDLVWCSIYVNPSRETQRYEVTSASDIAENFIEA